MAPPNYIADVEDFAQTALQEVASQGYSTAASNVFVTGNSLGGYAAELAAWQEGYGGATFGAGEDVAGTEVTAYSGSSPTTTIYQAGGLNAPTAEFPSGVPTDCPSAAELWSGIISATMSAGGSDGAVTTAAPALLRGNHQIISHAAELALAPTHIGVWHSPLIQAA